MPLLLCHCWIHFHSPERLSTPKNVRDNKNTYNMPKKKQKTIQIFQLKSFTSSSGALHLMSSCSSSEKTWGSLKRRWASWYGQSSGIWYLHTERDVSHTEIGMVDKCIKMVTYQGQSSMKQITVNNKFFLHYLQCFHCYMYNTIIKFVDWLIRMT